jgi:short-subunit dehydrogenase
VNNAGTNVRKSILDATMEEFHAITRVNQVEKI